MYHTSSTGPQAVQYKYRLYKAKRDGTPNKSFPSSEIYVLQALRIIHMASHKEWAFNDDLTILYFNNLIEHEVSSSVNTPVVYMYIVYLHEIPNINYRPVEIFSINYRPVEIFSINYRPVEIFRIPKTQSEINNESRDSNNSSKNCVQEHKKKALNVGRSWT